MSSEDAEHNEACLGATLRNVQRRMEERSRNNTDRPQLTESDPLLFAQKMAGDLSLDVTNGVSTGNLNQVFALRDQNHDKSSEAGRVEGFHAPELAGEAALHSTNDSQPLLTNESADGPANNFSFAATDADTSPLQPSARFGISEMQQPLSSMTLQVSSGRSSTVTPPLPTNLTASEWTAQNFTIEETVLLGESSTVALPSLPPLKPSEWLARDFYLQETAEQSGWISTLQHYLDVESTNTIFEIVRFQIYDDRFQELVNEASPLFSRLPTPPILPNLQYNQQGLMEATPGITLPLNIQGLALPPTLVATAHNNIQEVEGTEVHTASQYHGVSSSGQKRKFSWEEDILQTPSSQSGIIVPHAPSNQNKKFNLAPPMLQAPAYRNLSSNNRVIQTAGQVLGNQNCNSRLVCQGSAQSWVTQNRSAILAPQAASIQALHNQNRHSNQIFFYAQGNSNGHFNPSRTAVRPPCNMSYGPIYQQMGLSPDPFVRIYMLNQGSRVCDT